MIFERGPKAADSNIAKFTDYILPSLTNSIGPALGVQALKNISYPAQVLAKSCKMIPVMIVGTIFHRKRYSLIEYLCAFFIAGGISIFALFKQSSAVLGKLASPNAPLGYALVFCNLFMDGYTNSFQDDLKARKPDTSAMQFMCWINFWCSVFSAIYQFFFSDIGMSAVNFLTIHPAAVKDVLLFCACGVFGQQFIFLTISSFGALVNVTITTTRKFINILLSVVINGTALMPLQWAGVIMVFTGLTMKEVAKVMGRKPKKAEHTQ